MGALFDLRRAPPPAPPAAPAHWSTSIRSMVRLSGPGPGSFSRRTAVAQERRRALPKPGGSPNPQASHETSSEPPSQRGGISPLSLCLLHFQPQHSNLIMLNVKLSLVMCSNDCYLTVLKRKMWQSTKTLPKEHKAVKHRVWITYYNRIRVWWSHGEVNF